MSASICIENNRKNWVEMKVVDSGIEALFRIEHEEMFEIILEYIDMNDQHIESLLEYLKKHHYDKFCESAEDLREED